MTRAEGKLEFVNRQLLDYFGKTLDELKGWATNDVIHPDDLPRVIAAFKNSIETGQPYDTEHCCRRGDPDRMAEILVNLVKSGDMPQRLSMGADSWDDGEAARATS